MPTYLLWFYSSVGKIRDALVETELRQFVVRDQKVFELKHQTVTTKL